MKKITDKQSFIDETKTNLELIGYSADFDVIDEETDASFCCVEKRIDDVVPKEGILGITMSLNFKDNGKMPDTPESAMVDGCEIVCSKTGEKYEFYGPYHFFPMTKQLDGSYSMRMLFYCEPNTDNDDDYDLDAIEKKFADGNANVKLKVAAQNGFTAEVFDLTGNIVIDGNIHDGCSLRKENELYVVCEPESLTFYGKED